MKQAPPARDGATQAEMEEAQRLLAQVRPVRGEKRVVYRCDCPGCGKLFVHRFVPYGIGRGASFGKCMCQLTANRMHLTTKIAEATP